MKIGPCVVLVLVGLVAAVARGEEAGKLEPLARFVGEWTLDAKWADGTALRARAEYELGLEKKIMRGRTFIIDAEGKERQRYEDVMAWDGRRGSLVDVSFSVDGAVNEIVVEKKDEVTLLWGWTPYQEGREGKVRQTIQFKGEDRFAWVVELKGEEGWRKIMEGTWVRAKR
jgi:hypothetical protein